MLSTSGAGPCRAGSPNPAKQAKPALDRDAKGRGMASATDYGRIIVLAGAGASRALGFPTMAEFPKLFASIGGELSDLTDGMGWAEKGGDLEFIYDRLDLYVEAGQCCVEEGDMNLQQAFGGSDHAAELCGRARSALSRLEELIVEKLGKVTCSERPPLMNYSQVVNELIRISGSPLRVFTTNYDLTFESLPCLSKPGALVNGIRPDRRSREFRWSRAASDDAADEATRVVLYRLHGCSHWFADADAGEFDRIVYLPELPRFEKNTRPIVIFPARRKAGLEYRNPFSFAYNELRKAIVSAELCVVIGYSFRDPGIEDAILDARRLNRQMKFAVVDRREDSDSFYRKLGQWLTVCVQGEFGEPRVNSCLLSTCERLLSGKWVEIGDVPLVPGDACENRCAAASGCNVRVY